MREYRDYTIEIILKSPIVTALQSDTIFGHICWAVRFIYTDGEAKLGKFLDAYDDVPPLLVSNGFPVGYLPKPVLPPVTQAELDAVLKREDRIKNSFRIKNIKRWNLLPNSDFISLQEDKITPLSLFRLMNASYETIDKDLNSGQSVLVQHNTINRFENKVKKGLYVQEETFFSEDCGRFEIYLKTHFFTRDELKGIFEFISEGGFGRDKSIGKGHFSFDIKEGIDLPVSGRPNAFMTLSSYIPTEKDPVRGYYKTIHKYGKLGGLYAKGVSYVYGNPFKKPLIMFSAGSVFYDNDFTIGKTYGSLLKNIHQNDQIRHYAYAFPIGIKLEDTK